MGFPIMNMQGRIMTIIGCRYVDNVLLDAPWKITREMIASMKISLVVRGTVHDAGFYEEQDDPHRIPIELGIARSIQSESSLTVEDILSRVQTHRERLQKRHAVKSVSE